MDKITEGTKFRRDFFEGTEKKEGEEKNSSSTQAKWGRREKSFFTTRELLVCEIVRDESSIYRWRGWWKWNIGLMDFDGELNEIDGFGMWKLTWGILVQLWCGWDKKNLDLVHFIFGLIQSD